jgi:hypothetical protein
MLIWFAEDQCRQNLHVQSLALASTKPTGRLKMIADNRPTCLRLSHPTQVLKAVLLLLP